MYAAQIINKRRYNKSVDWYALGVLIFEMLYGVPPFHQGEHTNPVELYKAILRGPAHLRWPNFAPPVRDLIERLMEPEPSRRYGNLHNGAGDVFAHPWFKEVDWVKLVQRAVMAPYLPKIAGEGDSSA
jgi:protein kinase A